MSEPGAARPGRGLLGAALITIAVAGVLAGIAMVVVGLPEATPIQSVLLELAMAPISVSLAAALGLLAQRARPAGRRSLLVLAGAGVVGFAGVTSMVLAYAVGPRALVHLGQALVLVALLAALLIELRLQPPRRRVWTVVPDGADADRTAEDEPSD